MDESLLRSTRKTPAEVAQHFPRAIVAGRAGGAPAGMRTRPAQIEPAKRRAVVGMAEHRPRRPELVERELPVEDVAADQAEIALEVGGRERAVADHAGLE